MKPNPLSLIAALVLCALVSSAQIESNTGIGDPRYRLQLAGRSFIPASDLSSTRLASLDSAASRCNGKAMYIIQFTELPNEQTRQSLLRSGITLLEYISGNAYTASVSGRLKENVMLVGSRTRAILSLSPELKMRPALAGGILPSWAGSGGVVDLWISFPKSFDYETVATQLLQNNFEILSTELKDYRILSIRTSQSRILSLAALPVIDYVQLAPKQDEALNNKSLANSRGNILHSLLPGQRALRGEGVVVGIGDDSDPLNHIDFANRLINHTATVGGTHGVHVTGIVGGAGIVDERYIGYAPKAKMVTQLFSNILVNAAAYVQDHGMVITNNSYGNVVNDCASFGVYDLYSRVLDQQAFQLPNLEQVFASGNSGNFNCNNYTVGYGNVLGGYQSAKNVITVGNTTELGLVIASSSKGPTRDGRVKPEVMAQGTRVYSTWPYSIYSPASGTSMSSPAVAGGLALLYQRYRQMHGNANPDNALMKALICNGATDAGTPGIDYAYGFGLMNLLRSVTMLEQNNFYAGNVTAGGTDPHSISIPAGANIAQLKVMLYWNDSAAAVLSAHALVNDLDLVVTDPSLNPRLPQLLDTISNHVANAAGTGVDHINNVEQVVIDSPAPGTYTFTVKGTTIPFAPQYGYYIVFDTIPVSTTLTYPVGGEHFAAGDSLYISWDAYGNMANDFNLEYTDDNGTNWFSIATNISASTRQYNWHIPAGLTTDRARVRLTHNGTGIVKTSEIFTIIGVPVTTLSAVQCEGYIAFTWPAITGATDYEVMMLRGGGDEMTSVGTTTSTSYSIGGLARDSMYFVSVRARLNGNPGRRSYAFSRVPNTGTCAGSISDNDMKMVALLAPSSGRKFTSTELTAATNISIRIKNLDDVTTSGNIPVTYVINGATPVNESIIAPNIAAGASFDYTFTTPASLSAIGNYDLRVSVSYPSDGVQSNDTIGTVVKQLDNPFIDLTTTFLDDIETASVESDTTKQTGLQGLDRYDFNNSTSSGRIRTFVNTGIAYSGSKALSLDAYHYIASGNRDSLTGTFNLQGYDDAVDDIRLDFMYKQHGQLANAANKLWIRASDTDPWIVAYDLYANQADPGVFTRSASIELSDLLVANVKQFSSSFQARWGQWGQILLADNETAAGYTFDDIRLYRVSSDIQVIRIDTPIVASCGLGSNVPVRITIRNSSNSTINNIPIHFKIDNLSPVNELIASIGGNTTVSYTFSATADLSAQGLHDVVTWSDLPADSFHDNDTARVQLFNAPLITTFPYIENFEGGNGGWHAAGKNSSWEYGTPASVKIHRAASGIKAWKTMLAGNYNDLEQSYLYSPCFDVSSLTTPTLSFAVALDVEDCGTGLCDAAYAEYSADGVTWTRLGAMNTGTNWYNKNYSGDQLWSVQDYTRWHVATIPLPTGYSRLRVRFVMQSDPYVSKEGIAIDDIHVYDNSMGIYSGPPYTSAIVSQAGVSGSSWVNFTSGGKLIASVNPNGQTLGNTDAQAYINTGAVRYYYTQYYHNRNITIKPANRTLADSASVRFYFLDSETDSLINATGCSTCTKPASAYELGVSKYTDATTSHENGTLADNGGGLWSFVNANHLTLVPFDAGYYAEFKVKDFSEFWLNNGGLDNNHTLPVTLASFTARKQSNRDVLVEWTSETELNVDRYELEVARGNDEYRLNRFALLNKKSSAGNSTSARYYSYVDNEANKSGVRYYRLKMIDLDGRITYSAIRPVVFNDDVIWSVYPNPSNGIFNLVYQVGEGEIVNVVVHDASGRVVKRMVLTGSGFMQKAEINITGGIFASGLYLLDASAGGVMHSFRVVKK